MSVLTTNRSYPVPSPYTDPYWDNFWTYAEAIDQDVQTAFDAIGAATGNTDATYNAYGAAAAIVTIDNAQGQGDLRWKPTNAFSYCIDLGDTTGTADGFQVYDGAAEYWRLTRKANNEIDLEAQLRNVFYTTSAAFGITAAGTVTIDTAAALTLGGSTVAIAADGTTVSFDDGYRGASTLAAALDLANNSAEYDTYVVNYGQVSLINALNQAVGGGGGGVDLDDGYNNFGAVPATIVVDNAQGQGDVTWDLTGDFSFNIDLGNVTNAADGFQVFDGVGTEYWRLIRKAANKIDLETALQNAAYATSGTFDVAATGDVVIDSAIGTTISGATVALNSDGGDITATPGAGDYSFVVNIVNVTNTSDGFSVVCGADYFNVIRKSANLADIETALRNIDFNASGTFDIDSTSVATIDSDAGLILGGATVAIAADGTVVTFDDGYRGASTKAAVLALTNATAEWTTFVANYGQVSLINALNQAAGGGGAGDLDDGYDNFGAVPALVTIDNAQGQGDLTFAPTGEISLNVNLGDNVGTVDGFQVFDGVGTEYWRLIRKANNAMDLETALQNAAYVTSGTFDINSTGAVGIDSDGAVDLAGATVTIEADGGIVQVNVSNGSMIIDAPAASNDAALTIQQADVTNAVPALIIDKTLDDFLGLEFQSVANAFLFGANDIETSYYQTNSTEGGLDMAVQHVGSGAGAVNLILEADNNSTGDADVTINAETGAGDPTITIISGDATDAVSIGFTATNITVDLNLVTTDDLDGFIIDGGGNHGGHHWTALVDTTNEWMYVTSELYSYELAAGVGGITLSASAGNISLIATDPGESGADILLDAEDDIEIDADDALTLGGATIGITADGGDITFGASGDINLNPTGVTKVRQLKWVFVPIQWPENGASEPEYVTLLADLPGQVRIRNFDTASDEQVTIPWPVDPDIDATENVIFRVQCWISSDAPAGTEAIAFELDGYSIGQGDSLSVSAFPGTPATSTIADMVGAGVDAQYDNCLTAASGAVPITNLAAWETVMFNLVRDTGVANDYGHDIGVSGIWLGYYTLGT